MKKCLLLSLLLISLAGYSQNPSDSLSAPLLDVTTNTGISPVSGPKEDLYLKGRLHASKYYRKYKGASTGTLLASLFSPLLGLAPAIACSASGPKVENLGIPDETLFLQREYADGYIREAKRIKRAKVWTNWGIGFGANLIFAVIVASR